MSIYNHLYNWRYVGSTEKPFHILGCGRSRTINVLKHYVSSYNPCKHLNLSRSLRYHQSGSAVLRQVHFLILRHRFIDFADVQPLIPPQSFKVKHKNTAWFIEAVLPLSSLPLSPLPRPPRPTQSPSHLSLVSAPAGRL